MAAECLKPGMSVSLVARRHGISATLLFKWKQLMNDGGYLAIESGKEVVSAWEVKVVNKKVRELERMLGRKTIDAQILRVALEVAQAKAKQALHNIWQAQTLEAAEKDFDLSIKTYEAK